MNSQQFAPIILTPGQHADEILSAPMSQRERLRQVDERSLDVLYDDQLRQIARALGEPYPPPPRPVDPIAALMWVGIWALNIGAWAGAVVIGFQVLRP